jgi:hypothetical protein
LFPALVEQFPCPRFSPIISLPNSMIADAEVRSFDVRLIDFDTWREL